MENYTESLKAIEQSIDSISVNLPETASLDTDGIQAAIVDGFARLGPGLGGQWFDKSLENIDEHLAELNETMDHQRDWLHDIHVSLRHLAERKAGHKLGGYWEDQ
tara:strand:- start:86 stop:400 length:315 start_codon:yes stop_codon:yes gene_type:complete